MKKKKTMTSDTVAAVFSVLNFIAIYGMIMGFFVIQFYKKRWPFDNGGGEEIIIFGQESGEDNVDTYNVDKF